MKKILPHRSLLFAAIVSSSTAVIGLIGGIGIEAVKTRLIGITPLIIALPAMNAMAGDYATIITAHIGDPEAGPRLKRKLAIALLAAVPISILGVVLLSFFFSSLRGYALETALVQRFFTFIAAALISVVLVTFVTTIILNKVLENRQQNSDDVLIPATNVLASVLMLSWFALAVWIIF